MGNHAAACSMQSQACQMVCHVVLQEEFWTWATNKTSFEALVTPRGLLVVPYRQKGFLGGSSPTCFGIPSAPAGNVSRHMSALHGHEGPTLTSEWMRVASQCVVALRATWQYFGRPGVHRRTKRRGRRLLWPICYFLEHHKALAEHMVKCSSFRLWWSKQVDQAEGQAAILAREQRNHIVSKLHSIMRPFLLQRIEVAIASALLVL